MNGLLKKNERRQAELIERLYIEGKPVSVTEMAAKLKHSERAIIIDIGNIQEMFPFLNLKLENYLISMELEYNYNLDYVYQKMYKNNLGVILLEYLFFNKKASLEELTKHLQVSQATIYRLIQQINETLYLKHHIKIDTNPFKVSGNEKDIRRFYTQLFSDITLMFKWPFETVEENAISELIRIVSKVMNHPINYVGLDYMKYMLSVNLIRTKQQHFATIHKERLNLVEQLYNSPDFKDKKEKLSKLLGIKLTPNILKQLFYLFLNTDYILPNLYLPMQSIKMEDRMYSLNYLNDIIEALRSDYDLTLKNPRQLSTELYNSVRLYRNDLDSENLIHDYKTTYIDHLMKEFPHFTKNAQKRFKEYCEDSGIEWNLFYRNQLIYQLFIHWECLYTQLVNNNKVIEAVILCKYDFNHAHFLKEYFEMHMGGFIRFNVYDQPELSLNALKKAKEPIILSTFHIPGIEGKHVINLNFYPTHMDIRRIHQAVSLIQKNKND